MTPVVRQLATGGFDHNFSYLIHDPESGDTALVDPCGNPAVIRQALREFRTFRPCVVLLTHGHRDHHDAWPAIRETFPAPIAAHPDCTPTPGLPLADHQRIPLGNAWLECLHAPGHTHDSVLYRLGSLALFTGDTLFVDCCGYCDAESMFHTLRTVVLPLPDELELYPGHDYGRAPHVPLGEEKHRNPYLSAATLTEFQERLKDL